MPVARCSVHGAGGETGAVCRVGKKARKREGMEGKVRGAGCRVRGAGCRVSGDGCRATEDIE